MEHILIYLCVVIVIIYCIYVGIVYMNNIMLFLPEDISRKEYDNFCLENYDHYIPYEFLSNDKECKLVGGLYNSYRTPSWNDKIYLYSHGNTSWIGNILDGNLIKLLSRYGSIFVYDYRGFGCNDGVPSDIGLENDAIGAWKFVTSKVNPLNIIVVGHSLGCGVSCRLLAYLAKNNFKSLPEHLILNAPFSSVRDMAMHVLPSLAWLSLYEFDNMANAKHFDDKIEICVLHSKDDEVIPYYFAEKLANFINCIFIEIYGNHSDQKYSNEAFEYIHKISNK